MVQPIEAEAPYKAPERKGNGSVRRPFDHIVGGDPSTMGTWLAATVVVCGMLALWEFAHRFGYIPALMSAPSGIAHDVGVLAEKRTLDDHFLASLRRVLVGVTIGTVVGYPLACWAITHRWLRAILSVLLPFWVALPSIAFLFIGVFVFGIGENLKYVMGVWLALRYQVYFVFQQSHALFVRDRDMMNAAEEFVQNRWQLIRHIVMPLMLPAFFDGLAWSVFGMWSLLIVIEQVNAIYGLGGIFALANIRPQLSLMISSACAIAFCAMINVWIIDRIKRWVVWW